MEIYVEMLPQGWSDWRTEPYRWQIGRVRKTRPINVATEGYWKRVPLYPSADQMYQVEDQL